MRGHEYTLMLTRMDMLHHKSDSIFSLNGLNIKELQFVHFTW